MRAIHPWFRIEAGAVCYVTTLHRIHHKRHVRKLQDKMYEIYGFDKPEGWKNYVKKETEIRMGL